MWKLLKLDRKCIVVTRKSNFVEFTQPFKEIWGTKAVRFLEGKINKNDLIINQVAI